MAGALDIGTLLGHLDLDIGPMQDAIEKGDAKLKQGGAQLSKSAKAIGIGVGAAIALSMADAFNAESVNAKLAGQLGLSKDESARAGKVAGEVYAQNYGDSLATVSEAIGSVIKNLDGMRDATDEDLADISKRALNVASTFNVDLNGATRAAGTLMKNGLARNAQEAFDIIAKGLQSGVNSADDYLDTLSEYSTIFRTMGLSGDDALGLLSQGLQGGARDADQVADSLKELLLRVQAGDAAGGLRAIGLDAQAMARDISAGGEVAREATGKIIDGFTGVKDPADQAQVALGLFGTKAEDAQQALGSLDLRTAKSDFEALNGPIAGTGDALDKTLGETRAAGFEKFVRSIEGVATSFGTKLLPVADLVLTTLSGLFSIIEGAVEVFTGLPAGIQIAIGALVLLRIAVSSVGTAIKAAFISNPVGIAIAAITTVIGFFVGSSEDAAEATELWRGKVADLKGTLDQASGAVTALTRQKVVDQVGADVMKRWEELGINITLATDAMVGVPGAAAKGAAGMQELAAAAIRTGEDFRDTLPLIEAAGVTAEELAAAFLNQDYSAVSGRLDAAGLSVENLDQRMRDQMGTLGELGGAYGTILSQADAVAGAQEELATGNKAVTGSSTTAAAGLEGVGTAGQNAAGGLTAAGVAALGAADPMTQMEAMFAKVDQAAADADDSVRFFDLSIDELLGGTVSAAAAAKVMDDAIRGAGDAFKDAKVASDESQKSLLNSAGAIDTSTEAGSKLYDGLQEMAKAYDIATTSAYDTARQNGDTAGALGKAREAADLARAAFREQATQLGLTDAQADILADSLGIVGGVRLEDKNFSVNAKGLVDTQEGLDKINRTVLEQKTLTIGAQVTGAVQAAARALGLNPGQLAEGGRVDRPGPKGVDTLPYMLAHGEYVLSDEIVDALGGFAGVDALVASVRTGAAQGIAGNLGATSYSAAMASPAPAASSRTQLAEHLSITTASVDVDDALEHALHRFGMVAAG